KSSLKGNTGWFVGPTAKFIFPVVGLGFEANVLYSQTNLEIEGQNVTAQNIDIPVYLRYELSLPVVSKYIEPFIAVGPQFSWNIGDSDVTLQSVRDMVNSSGNANIDQILNNIPNVDDPLKVYRLKDSNISLNLGLGVILFEHLQIHANYNLSFDNTAEIIENGISIPGIIEMSKNISELKTNTWQISLAYIF
ncbi:MAG: outer membrane beta-barrel protein, partial [Bacteroidaceae bacterium]|nr:outer membrane beta-barrel protein [Bacteroidaceae bacterium]